MLYRFGRSLSWLVVKMFGRAEFLGTKNVPRTGPVLLAPNHISFLDPPAVGAGLPRPVRFMAKIELFKIPVLGTLIAKVGAFPVKQNTADRNAIRKALELLKEDEVVCIFPEGTRSEGGVLLEPQSGVGMIALKSKAPVVPVAVIGTDDVLRRHSPLLHFGKIKMVYGEPISFDDLYEGGSGREAVDEVGRRVMDAISKLLEAHKPERK